MMFCYNDTATSHIYTYVHTLSLHDALLILPRRLCLLGLGAALVAVSPAVGVIPGPGGIIVFAIGLALVLKNSQGAKKRYIWLKRRWPRLGRMADRGLGRRPKKPRGD